MALSLATEAASGDGEGAGVATTMFDRPNGTQPPVTLPTLLLTAAPNGDSGGVGAAAAAPQPSSPRRRSMVTVTTADHTVTTFTAGLPPVGPVLSPSDCGGGGGKAWAGTRSPAIAPCFTVDCRRLAIVAPTMESATRSLRGFSRASHTLLFPTIGINFYPPLFASFLPFLNLLTNISLSLSLSLCVCVRVCVCVFFFNFKCTPSANSFFFQFFFFWLGTEQKETGR